MKRSSLLVAIGFASVIGSGLASAMNHGGGGECPSHKGGMPIEEIDTNKDGALSAAEISTFHKKHFDDADANKDGSLDANEFKLMHEKEMARRHEAKFKAMDADGNGKLSSDELGKKRGMGITRCDTDKNGDVSKAELENCRMMKGKMHGGMSDAKP